jgi:hypothetical protein
VDGTIVLTNPDGRLRFPNDADITKTLTVPHNGSWVDFEISGETGSAALNDAVIEAHCNTPTGTLKGSKTVTVFWFDQAKMEVTSGGDYTISGGRYTVAGGSAANLSAEARIRPAGANCAAPQIKNLRIGIAQNTFPPRVRTINWNAPAIRWNPGIAVGTKVTVANAMRRTITVGVTANDSTAAVDPLYDQPGKAGPDGTLDANSLTPPKGCSGGGVATSHDTPSIPTAKLTLPAIATTGAIVGAVDWNFVNVTHRDNYRDWAVVFNILNNDVFPLKERVWKTNMDSAAAGAQHITIEAEGAPTVAPLSGTPFSNTLSNDPANSVIGSVGAATTTFTKT